MLDRFDALTGILVGTLLFALLKASFLNLRTWRAPLLSSLFGILVGTMLFALLQNPLRNRAKWCVPLVFGFS